MSAAFREQYDRTKRWYDRLAALNRGRLPDVPSENYLDEIYAFFMNCHHLQDWIKNDPTLPASVRNAVEDHINSTRPLRLCADICNSLKHFQRTKSNRSGESPRFGRRQYAVDLGTTPTAISLKYEVDTTTGPIDASQLASECIAAWDAFLTANRLTV